MSRPAPVLRFLADVDPERGPFGLLGLGPEACDDAAIDAALRRQLERVARHPHGATVEADEVRLALHVAAAQLRDPAVRAELIDDLAALAVRREGRPQAPLAPGVAKDTRRAAAPTGAYDPSVASFERAAMWVLAHSGGWNTEAKRRLWSLAHATSVPPESVQRIVMRMAQRMSQRAASAGASRSRAVALTPAPAAASTPAPTTPLKRWGPLALLVLLTLSSLVMLRQIAVIQARQSKHRVVTLAPATPAVTPEASAVEAGQLPPTLPESAAEPARADEAPLAEAPSAPLEEDGAWDFVDDVGAPENPAIPAPALAGSRLDIEQWQKAAHEALALQVTTRPEPVDQLHRATRLAFVHAAAEALAAYGPDPELLSKARNLKAPTGALAAKKEDLEAQLFRMTAPATSDDGRVALAFQAARRQPGSSMETLSRLRFRQTPLGPADCDIIAEVALLAPTHELREQARRFVDDQSNNPFMIYGLLSALDRAPRIARTSQLIESVTGRSLPAIADPSWAASARAAVLARLVQLLAAARMPEVDELAVQLADAYEAAADVAAPAPSAGVPAAEQDGGSTSTQFGSDATAPDTPPDFTHAMRLVEAWIQRADAFRAVPARATRLDAILRRRDARLALAKGPIRTFVAEQTAIVELSAFVISGEYTTRAAEVAEVVDRAARDRRAARHVLEQIEANERAIVRLWLIRFNAPPLSLGGSI